MSNNKLNVILVDDHKLFRNGIKLLIELENYGKVVAEANNGKEFIKLLENYQPDLVFMDIDMPEMNGIEATKIATEMQPDIKILALTMFGDEKHYTSMIQAGAKGFILKKSGKPELEKAIQVVAAGESYFSNELLRKIIVEIGNKKITERENSSEIVEFTDREMEIIKLLCNGAETKEIADKLFLSTRTIDSYRSKLLTKTGTKNTVSLVIYAIKNGLVKI